MPVFTAAPNQDALGQFEPRLAAMAAAIETLLDGLLTPTTQNRAYLFADSRRSAGDGR
jgi:hypothetical protein